MQKQTRKRTTWLLAGGLLITLLTVRFWWTSPEGILAAAPLLERRGEESGQWLRDKLIACGPRAIQPTILAIAEHSPWVRNYAYLPQVLRHFGEPARRELIAAIDKEPDSKRRAYLISSLQSGFNDFSRLDKVLTNAKYESSRWSLMHIAAEVRQAFPNGPDLVRAEGINPDFVRWWSRK